MGHLFVANVPVGGPDDATFRTLRSLRDASLVVSTDLPRARQLLQQHGITASLADLSSLPDLLGALDEGDVVLLLEGWWPAPPAPAAALIQAAVERGIRVVPLPGPVLPVTALAISGLPADSFVYLGWLPGQSESLRPLLASVAGERRTLVALAQGGDLPDLLAAMHAAWGERPLVLVDPSGPGEVAHRGSLSAAGALPAEPLPPGPCALVVGGAREQPVTWDEDRLLGALEAGLHAGLGAAEVSRRLAAESGWPRREVYRRAVAVSSPVPWAPLRLAALAKDKVWGGTRLGPMFGAEPGAPRRIGEVWAVWDELVIEGGPFAGQSLSELVRRHPQALLGSRLSGRPARFPLLAKFLEAQETLSVQVHPDDRYAGRREGQPFGKAEAWLVLDAAPGARLFHGVNRVLSRAEAERAIGVGTFQDLLAEVEVAPGDVILNLPGTVHAVGPGLLLYELQQSSDLTYRLYDWNRNDPGRELHVERALDVATLHPFLAHKVEPVSTPLPGGVQSFLCACRHFCLERLEVESSVTGRPSGVCFHLLTAVEGSGAVHLPGDAVPPSRLRAGESLLVPAAVPEYSIRAHNRPLVVIKSSVPDLVDDVVRPLQAAGIPAARILQLGGDPAQSDLAGALGWPWSTASPHEP